MSELYTHIALPRPRSIRLLELRSSIDRESLLRCDLIVADLDQFQSYEALSYAWEAGGPVEHIWCQDRVLPITKNCEAALRRLRHQSKKRLLWIDSICIDQSSMSERNSQVALMKDIYEQASTVVIWLGESTPESQEIFKHLRVFSGHVMNNGIPFKIREYLSMRRVRKIKTRWDLTDDRKISQYPDSLMEIPGMLDVFGRSWFRRTWTIQELAFARDALVMCGQDFMYWDIFHITLTWLHSFPEFTGTFHLLQKYFLPVRLVSYFRPNPGQKKKQSLRFLNKRKMYIWKPEKNLHANAISDILITCRAQASTDPKDKIFALNGLFKIAGLEISEPDYSKSIENIFAEATASVIRYDKSLRVLTQVCATQKTQSWPSWVPDWSHPKISEFPGQWNDATPGSPAVFQFSDDGLNVVLTGKVIDTVKRVAFPLLTVEDARAGDANAVAGVQMANIYILRDWLSYVSILADSLKGGEDVNDVFCSVLCRGGFVSTDLRRGYKEWSLWITAGTAASHVTSIDVDVCYDHYFQKAVPDSARETGSKIYLEYKIWSLLYVLEKCRMFNVMMLEHLVDHRIFSTDQNRIGLVPSAQEGDLVVLLSGLRYPFIVRKVFSEHREPRGFRLVCPAYLHGIMKGEAWNNDGTDLSEFCFI